MNALTAALKEELNVEMISIGGLQIPESVVVSWGIMAFLVIGSILLTRNLRVDHITKRQAILETVVTFINDFFVGLLGEKEKQQLLADAQKQADAIVAEGKRNAEAERQHKLREADAQTTALAREMCEKLLARNLTQQDDARLLDDLLQKAGVDDGN